MKILSLFSGIGGFDKAFEDIFGKDHEVWFSEIDKYAIQVYKNHFPNATELGDITKIDIQSLPQMDFIVGGSPCQDLSIAKKNRQGLDGARSGLFWKFVEIIKTNKPKYFVLENVNSMPKEAKQIITDTLGVEPIMINASLVSAQNRKRLFWTNIPNVTLPEDRGVLLKDILEPQVDEGFYIKDKSNTVRSSGLGSKFGDKHCWDSIRIGQFNKGGQGDRIYSTDGKSINLSANGGGRGAKTGLYLVAPNGKEIILGNEELQVLKEGRTELGKKSRQEIRKLTGKDSTFRSKDHKAYFGREGIKANCITTGLGVEGMIAIIPEATKKGYAVAHEGQSIDLSFPTSKTRRGRVGGKLIIANNYNKRVFNDKCGTIGTSMGRTAKQGIAIYKNEISKDSFIRKLTPIECARLQCFPDNWCEGLSNTQQYKCYGNAVNVEVVKHILSQLKKTP